MRKVVVEPLLRVGKAVGAEVEVFAGEATVANTLDALLAAITRGSMNWCPRGGGGDQDLSCSDTECFVIPRIFDWEEVMTLLVLGSDGGGGNTLLTKVEVRTLDALVPHTAHACVTAITSYAILLHTLAIGLYCLEDGVIAWNVNREQAVLDIVALANLGVVKTT